MQGIHEEKWLEGVRPDDSTVDVAVLALRNRLEAVQHFLPLAANDADKDIEYVHQLRIWTRRAASALRLYRKFLPRQRLAWVKKQIKRIRQVANDARDCDVQIQRLSKEDSDEAACWIKRLRAERAQAQKPLVAICEKLGDGDRIQRRGTKLLDRVRIRTKKDAQPLLTRFADWARASLQQLVERFFEAVPPDDADTKRLHFFRIRGKQLRYAMELLAPAFPLEFREELYPVVEELQDKLGNINDLEVSVVRLDSFADADKVRGNLSKKEQGRLDRARKEYRRWWTAARQQDLRLGFEAILGTTAATVGINGHTLPAVRQRCVSPSEAVTGSSKDSMGTPEFVPSAVRPVALPKASAKGKSRMVGELGAKELLLPNLVNEALAANDRAKYLISLLQSAREHADHPDLAVNDLREERLASELGDSSLDQIVEQSRVETPGRYHVPACGTIHEQLVQEIRHMISPMHAVAAESGKQPAHAYEKRLDALLAEAPPLTDDRIPGVYIDHLTSARRKQQDSLHLPIMDLHKELNRLQQQIASESIVGACAYGVRDADRSLVAAFMAGVNQTRPLKFDHPGLGTTATRAGEKLIIQNDIGTTDAHVLIVHVEGLKVTLTHTDIHIERLVFFQNLFAGFAVAWEDTRSRRATGLEEELYHLCQGTFTAKDQADLEAYLRFLGSRLVFLIDWNRARKRLRKFAPRRICLEVLRWAADNNIGHMGFLVLGGDQLLLDAIQAAGQSSLPVGGQLADILGPEKVTEFLKFTVKTATEGLLAGRSEFLIRDEIGTELRQYIATVQQGFLEIAAQHATLIVELAMASREGIEAVPGGDMDFLQRTSVRAKKWEHMADELVKKSRTIRIRSNTAEKTPELLEKADDAADKLEEAIFLLTLLPDKKGAAVFGAPLHDLAALLVQGAEEYLKCVETARQLHRGSSREQVQDFLEAVDRTLTSEHDTDAAHRRAQSSIPTFPGDCKQLYLFTEVADNLEEAADALLHSALMLRDYILSEVLTR
jgi:CHAD domain-containing protein/uncharacterized protein Yka (UPF0111/DUF47 family)